MESIKRGVKDYPLCKKWIDIKRRCLNESATNYKDYGGRGITVCKEWENSLSTFIDWCINNGWEEGLEIDRMNNNGNYEPDNCRFLSHQDNMINQRLMRENNTSGYR